MRRRAQINRPDRRRNRYPRSSAEGFFNTIRRLQPSRMRNIAAIHSAGQQRLKLQSRLTPRFADVVQDCLLRRAQVGRNRHLCFGGYRRANLATQLAYFGHCPYQYNRMRQVGLACKTSQPSAFGL
jgi:hypothetical protein